MGNHDIVTAELHKSRHDHIEHRRILYHIIIDGCKLFYLVWDRHTRIYKFRECIYDLSVLHLDRTDLYDLVVLLGKSRCLYIKYHVFRIKALIP